VLEQYINQGGQYVLLKAHLGAGQVASQAVQGFVLDLKDVFAE
jgi:hypothetical protein